MYPGGATTVKYLNYILVTIVLTGCAAKFNYVQQSESDAKFFFGDRLGGDGFYTPNRNVLISLEGNICNSYKQIGLMTKNSLVPAEESRTSFLPSGKEVYLKGTYSNSSGSRLFSCESRPVSFIPQDGKVYSVDVSRMTHICVLSVKEVLPDGSYSVDDVVTNYLDECS